jgi:hypothetical protein
MPVISLEQLEASIARGIITREQYERIIAEAGVVAAGAEAAGPDESRRGFNWVTIAYFLGAGIVLYAFGWLLVDRWTVLGPGGVLAVSLAYSAIFAFVAWWLFRERYPVAGGLATTLVVGMTPITIWALQHLIGAWPDYNYAVCRDAGPWFFGCAGRWLPVQLATIGAALIALRRIRFSFLTAPIAIALFFLVTTTVEIIFGADHGPAAAGWVSVATASLLATVAYAVERRTLGQEDFAIWVYLASLVVATLAVGELWQVEPMVRHMLAPIALLLMAAALYLRRRTFLVFSVLALFAWLTYLAQDVFRTTLAFPLLLATFGIALILVTVWLQKNFAVLVKLVGGTETGGHPRFPGGYAAFLTPLLLTLLVVGDARVRDRELIAQSAVTRLRYDHHQRTLKRQRLQAAVERAARDSAAARSPADGRASAR